MKNHLSQTSKLDAKSWSLQAWETCPGARNADGTAVPACAACYARTGFYVFGKVKANRADNREAWKGAGLVDAMVAALEGESLFRWFDSGDLYHPALAEKVKEVITRTPWVKHWLPTRAYKVPRLRAIVEQIAALPNVAVRYSSDSITGEFTPGFHGSVIVPSADEAPAGTVVCRAYERGGACAGCTACYEKSVATVAYPAHGRVAKKLVKLVQIERTKRAA